MLGLPSREVFLVSWTSEWEQSFKLEKVKVQNAIGPYVVKIHHIGSTAVKHLNSKPIIDIAVELNSFNKIKECIDALKFIGYVSHGPNILPDRYYFTKNSNSKRTHQIHLYESGNKYLLEQLKFRDYLRNNTAVKNEYERLKLDLAKVHKHNKHQYAKEKTTFINDVLSKIN